jgi:hypothetical protein
MCAGSNAIDNAAQSERRAGGYHRRQRAIVLRPHDRKGIHTCQAGSLDATRESGKSPGSDNPVYVNQAGLDRTGFALMPINGC